MIYKDCEDISLLELRPASVDEEDDSYDYLIILADWKIYFLAKAIVTPMIKAILMRIHVNFLNDNKIC